LVVVEVVVVEEEESNDSRFGALTMGVGHAPLSPFIAISNGIQMLTE
jgi:hypothetical protein